EVLDAVGEPADRLRERVEYHAHGRRVGLQEGEEVVAREERGAGVLERRRRRGARAAVEERELAEVVARPPDRDERFLPEFSGERDLHRAVEDDVQVGARIVLPKERLAALERPHAHALRQLQELRFGKLAEQGVAPEVLGKT